MGLTFRFGNYKRRVRLGKRTVKDGEAAIIWDRCGRSREIVGPSLEYLFFSTIQFLDRHCARPDQYLRVLHRDGSISIIQGPATLFHNPTKHDCIETHHAVSLRNSGEMVVVLRGDQATEAAALEPTLKQNGGDAVAGSARIAASVNRVVVRGPALYVPDVKDDILEFHWAFNSEKGNEIQKIRKLSTAPIRLKTSNKTRTKDGVVFAIKHEVRVALTNIEVLLDCSSNDPLTDLRAALAAEVTSTGNTLNSKDLLGSSASLLTRLSELANFPGFVATAKATGFQILDFSLSGIAPSASFQKQLEAATTEEGEWRRRQTELEQQARLEESRLELANRRAAEERAAEEAKQRFELELLAAKSNALLNQAAQRNTQVLEFLEQLHTRGGVDLTALLKTYESLGSVPTEKLPPVFQVCRNAPAMQNEAPPPPPEWPPARYP